MAETHRAPHQPRFALRVGILSAAGIVHKTWPALHQAGHSVTWIGCRDADRGGAMVKEVMDKIATVSATPVGRAPQIASDYEQVVSSPDVDVVYIPLPTALRDYWVRRCIVHGKHVVGEKPAAVSAAQLYDWLSLMAPRRLLYMDGTMFSHGQRVQCVVNELQKLGPLHHIDVNFSFLASPDFLHKDIRVDTALEPQGALGDLGWYAVRWIQHLVGFALPAYVSARVVATTPSTLPSVSTTASEVAQQPQQPQQPPQQPVAEKVEERGGAITGFEGHLTFPAPEAGAPPITATFSCTFNAGYEQSVRAYARDGTVAVHGAINPTSEGPPSFTVERAHWTFDENGGKRPLEMALDVEEGVVKPLPGPSTVAKTIADEAADAQDSEEDNAYQIVQLWCDVGNALIRLGRDEPVLIHPEKGKHWTTMAYMTQYVLDQLLSAADVSGKAAAEEETRRAESEAQEKAKAAADATAAKEASRAKGALTASPRQGAVAPSTGAAEDKFPFALF